MNELNYPFDPDFIRKKRKSLKRALKAPGGGTNRICRRIAVLGGSTTHDIIEILELFLLDNGIQPEFYESGYAQYFQDVMFDSPALCFNLANIVKSIFGRNKKALILDLDNTLWGGAVGDDGPEGMWHGGAWKYIIGSGLLHCFYIVAGQMLEPVFKKTARLLRVNTQCWSWRMFQGLRTFFMVCIGFVFFRASSAGDAVRMFKASMAFNPWIFTDGSLLRLGYDAGEFIYQNF